MSLKIGLGIMGGISLEKYRTLIRGCCETWIKKLPLPAHLFNGDYEDAQFEQEMIELSGGKIIFHRLPTFIDNYQSASIKQFVGLAKMFEYHEKYDWYGIIGTDNYVHYDRLVSLFSQFDSTKSLVLGGTPGVVPQDLYYPFLLGGCGIFLSYPALEKLLNYEKDVQISNVYELNYTKLEVNALKLHQYWVERDIIKLKNLQMASDVALSYYLWQLNIPFVCMNDLFVSNYRNDDKLVNRLLIPRNVAINHFMDRPMMIEYEGLSKTFNDAQIYIREQYYKFWMAPSDINEHLITLLKYASECDTIAECSHGESISIWAFLHGLRDHGSFYYISNTVSYYLQSILDTAENAGIKMVYRRANSATFELPESIDLLFIDTFHVYGHLKRELEQHHTNVKKYIVMHDTYVDGLDGEAIRCNFNIKSLSEQYNYSIDEIMRGVRPAIDEFLEKHEEWEICYDVENNNGLVILKRI
jgi:hypothetical protein